MNIYFIKLKFCVIFSILLIGLHCAPKGLVTAEYDSGVCGVVKTAPDSLQLNSPCKFMVYGNSRPAYRINERLMRTSIWRTWRMLLFPFYQFYVLGDGIISGINQMRRIPDDGQRERRMVRDAIYDAVRAENADFVIHTGNSIEDGRRPMHLANFLAENTIEKPILNEIPFFQVAGQHEWTNDSAYGLPNFLAIFQQRLFYKIDLSEAAIFILNSDMIVDAAGLLNNQLQDSLFNHWFVSEVYHRDSGWLEKELAACDKPFKIICMHHSPVSFNRQHDDWSHPGDTALPEKRRRLLNLFQEQGVQLVFCGNERLFEHTMLRYTMNDSPKALHIVISGGGGVPLGELTDIKTRVKYLAEYHEDGFNVELMRQQKIYHYCAVEIAGDRMTVKVFEVTGEHEQPVRLTETITVSQ
ncbi:metallophosphoesterase [candidate division KSB1 bacterium]|nr:metallophosphoesterase [candidate division KSB1 bacterium]